MLEPLNKDIKEILAAGMKNETPRYIRFILNKYVITYYPKGDKTTKSTGQKAAFYYL